MPEDPMLSQAEIDALLRSLGEAAETPQVEEVPKAPEPYAPLEVARPATPRTLPEGIEMLLGVEVTCSVDLGEMELEFGELLSLGRSSLVVLSGTLDAPFVLRVNGVPFAYGTIVETNGRYGLRIIELAQPQEEAHAS
ncbi:MAG: FliM/FliN family flagellar motor switch protein [Thermaerobacter sp.]|nr:FliM/FliN family flagellar motor switch protein [Thermaerobacter sp.]